MKGHRRAQCPSYAGTAAGHVGYSSDEVDERHTTNSFSVHGVGGSGGKLAEVSLMVKPGMRASAHICRAVADTGAECCVAGRILGVKKCTLQLAGKVTSQVYFIQGVERFFLSVDAYRDLDLIDKDFPYHTQSSAMTAGGESAQCGTSPGQSTPVRSRPMPARPDQVPLAPTEANVPRLDKYLKEQFASTTFYKEAAPLPAMDCAPHSIHLLPNAVLFARHTPIQHWEQTLGG